MANPIVVEDIEKIKCALPNLDNFYGATVLVTGCAGFLGYYFMQFLVRHSKALAVKKVIGLDTFILNTPEWVAGLASEYPEILELQKFDISKDNLSQIKNLNSASLVIHGASIASPSFYRQYPVETIDANIWGLRRLLDFYRDSTDLKGFLFFSSSEIYGDPDPASIPTSEDYRGNVACTGPRACYDESKRFGETLCWVYATQYGMPITVARPFNNYGPGMRLGDKRLPADFARCILENKDIVIHSDGTPTRTFCYVADAITGYLLCLLHGKYDAFNIGIEKPEIMVRDLARIYQDAGNQLLGYSGKVIYEASSDPEYMTDNPNRRCPVIEKARHKLGYNPKVVVAEGVNRYLNFLKAEEV